MRVPQLPRNVLDALCSAAVHDFTMVIGKTILIGETYKVDDAGELVDFNHRRRIPVTITGCEIMSFDEAGNHCPRWYVMPNDGRTLAAAEPGSFIWGVIRNEVGDVSVPPYEVADNTGEIPVFRRWSQRELAILARSVVAQGQNVFTLAAPQLAPGDGPKLWRI